MTVSGTSPLGAEMTIEMDCLRGGFHISLVVPANNPAWRAEVTRIDLDDPSNGQIKVRGLTDIPPSTINNLVDYEIPVGCKQEYIYSVWDGTTLADELRLYPPESLRETCGVNYVLRDLMNPQESISVNFCFGTIDTMSYAIRAGIFNVIGRRDPVVVTDSQEMARGTLRFLSHNRDELYDLRRLLTELGNPLLFQLAHKYELGRKGVMYMMPLATTERWLPDGRIPQHVFEVEIVEVSAPPTSHILTKSGIPFDTSGFVGLPWLNRAGGAEVPNGTTTHTVNFGFTATAGRLLVLVAGGNSTVAHTVSGYTERVNSGNAFGNVTILTKTAAGGETSAPIVHTGTLANVVWQVYEFDAAGTWTASAQLADGTMTFPTLSGLPGVSIPQLVMAAFARGSMVTTASASADGWTGTTVEHADAYAVGGSAGFWMANAHEPQVTATSVTPAATITGSGNFSGSPWIKVVFALNVAVLTDPDWPSGGMLQRYATFSEMALSGKSFADVYFDVP